MTHYVLGNASHQQIDESRASVCSHDDLVASSFLSYPADDFFGWTPKSKMLNWNTGHAGLNSLEHASGLVVQIRGAGDFLPLFSV